MNLPASFARDGFLPPDKLRGKYRRLLVGTDGWANTGKTEFAMSAPTPGIIIALDRGFDSVLDNPNPPKTRQDGWAYKAIKIGLPTQYKQEEYLKQWIEFRNEYYKALANPDCRTVILDGDSDSWELQRLAEWGKVTQVPSLQYPGVNAARKGMIARAWDSGKIVIATNKLEEVYETKKNESGKEVQVKSGEIRRQGFKDWKYLWGVHLRHLYRAEDNTFGVEILMAKADTSLQGFQLWGPECNFQNLVQTIYPQIPLSEWGY
jgi:hypothetical protein